MSSRYFANTRVQARSGRARYSKSESLTWHRHQPRHYGYHTPKYIHDRNVEAAYKEMRKYRQAKKTLAIALGYPEEEIGNLAHHTLLSSAISELRSLQQRTDKPVHAHRLGDENAEHEELPFDTKGSLGSSQVQTASSSGSHGRKPLNKDTIDHILQLLDDLRNITDSSVVPNDVQVESEEGEILE
ncbi:hypothetical protein OF83DRAFT_1177496 [Amylostereum chailletii]|nr:hypothetical protein OF83DRAFT_1177496 [Amylostereum chailletii]